MRHTGAGRFSLPMAGRSPDFAGLGDTKSLQPVVEAVGRKHFVRAGAELRFDQGETRLKRRAHRLVGAGERVVEHDHVVAAGAGHSAE